MNSHNNILLIIVYWFNMGEKKLSKEETASLEEALKTLHFQKIKDEEITEGVIDPPTHSMLDRLMKYLMKDW